nr:MAK10-like protein [Tanacetum cinerariifolium]
MGDANPIHTLGDDSKPSHEGYKNTIELLEKNNVDPSPHERILLLVSLLNSFYREGSQNFATISLCSNNIKENLSQKHGLISKTYSKNPHHGIDVWLQFQISYDHVTPSTRRTIDQSAGDDMIGKINLLWKTISERLDDTPVHNTAGCPTTQMNFTSTNYLTKEELRDMESPINLMSRLHYNWIMRKRFGPRRKPSNPRKIFNFVGKVKGLKVFVGNFTYKCDFVVLEDATSVIDHDLGLIVFEKPFVEATMLVYDRKEGTIMFEKDKEKIVFKIPQKMEMFKHIDFTNVKTNRIPPFVIECDDDNSEKTHYFDSLDLGPECKHDENVCRAIRSLIAMKAKRNKGEVTLQLGAGDMSPGKGQHVAGESNNIPVPASDFRVLFCALIPIDGYQ